jgi:hypothetical protein
MHTRTLAPLASVVRRSALISLFLLLGFNAFAQNAPRASAAQSAARAQNAAPAPASAGMLLSQADATRMLAGYWRVQWREDDTQIGILHITGIGASENQVLLEGQYSPDGFSVCAVAGNWTYNSRVAYSAGASSETYELPNVLRMKFNCPTIRKEYTIESLVVLGSPIVHFVGRALIVQPDRRSTSSLTLSRFNAPN